MTAVRRHLGMLLAGVLLLSACSGPAATPAPEASPTPDQTASPEATPTPDPTTSPEPTASPSPTPDPTGSPPVAPSPTPATGTLYTVRGGDTLFGIARSFGTSVEQLQAWNVERYPTLAADPSRLETGWVLVVAGSPGVTPRPTPVSTPRPTAAPIPPPSASGCRAGNRVATGGQQVFRTIPGAGKALALTFDMGGRMEPAVDIMNFLVANKVCATIFPTGVMSNTPQGRQVMAIIKAHPELFEIGNHTMYHCDLLRGGGGSPTTGPCQTGGRPTADFIRRELREAEAILRAGTGQNPQPYWRPPYGAYDQAVLDAAASVGYTKTFMWDIDTVDWKPVSEGGPTAQQIAARVVNSAVSGSNVLFHLGGYNTLESLKIMVPALRDRGFTLTSLSDLLN
jgi:peptidoglycan/xylan/chitin deacetylase (PgdA/CDA1 family)/LysM repeat protein